MDGIIFERQEKSISCYRAWNVGTAIQGVVFRQQSWYKAAKFMLRKAMKHFGTDDALVRDSRPALSSQIEKEFTVCRLSC